MKRTNTPDRKKKRSLKRKKSKPGPKSQCTSPVIKETYRLCLLGMTNAQLAEWFAKDISTINHWYKTNPRFAQAVDKGRKHADGKVAEALYRTAMGFEHESFKFFKIPVTEKEYDEDGNVIKEISYHKIVKKRYTKKYKPDTKAALKFLAARNRNTWGESYKVEHKHAHMHVGGMNIHEIMDQASQYSDEELRAIAKLGLSEKAQQITDGQNPDAG